MVGFKNKLLHNSFGIIWKRFVRDIEDRDKELYKTLIAPFYKEFTKTKKIKKGPNLITQSESLSLEQIVMHKLWTDISVFSGATGETSSGLTEETRASVTLENYIQKYIKEKIPSYVSTKKVSNSQSGQNIRTEKKMLSNRRTSISSWNGIIKKRVKWW